MNGWDPEAELPLSERQIRRSSRAGLMATGAVHRALEHAGLAAADLDPGRTALVACSLQFAFPETERYYSLARDKGSPPSVWSTG
ncbi:hypothetical protein NKH18_42260 [Streptomyces sp. M10(2022)]